MKHACLTLGLLFVGMTALYAQTVVLPRAREPVVLCDFSQPASLSGWTGLKVSPAKLDGAPAMQFTFPRYVKGENEWPAVYLAQGAGLAASDWSHHALVAFDVAVDGDRPQQLSLELRNTAGQNGVTVALEALAGRTNHLQVSLADLREQLDLRHVEQIVFFTSRPPQQATLTVANLRLLPGERPAPVALDLCYPNYRELIFPGVDRVTVAADTHLAEYDLKSEQMTLQLKCAGGGRAVEIKRALGRGARATLSTASLPAGAIQASVSVIGPRGEKLMASAWTLRKLTPAEVRALAVYVDEHNNTIVDGQPFFPLGFYGNGKVEQMREVADSPFNCLLDYGTNAKPQAKMLEYLDEMRRRGLKLIYCLNDVYPAATYYADGSWEGVKGNQNIADAVMAAYRNHPALLAWYLNDELPPHMVPSLTEYYQRARANDPNHPAYIVIAAPPELRHFRATTDIMGADPYPIPQSPVTEVSDQTDNAVAGVGGHKPVWVVPQAFGWYQYRPEGSDRGRVPTEAELETGRAPTYEEERCMTYLALAHGAKGLIYYCYYDLRVLPQYAEMWGWMKQIGAEVKALSPVLLSSDDLGPARVTPATAPIHTKLKRHQGREILIAVNAGREPCEVMLESKHKLPAQVKVMFEDQTLPATGRQLKLSFKPLEVHVLDLGPAGK